MISQKILTRGDASNSSIVAQIDSYYQDKKDDYYSREDQPSQWQGKLADELKLAGEVSKLDFIMLMQGTHNGIELRKSKYTKKDNKDRLGIDLTFNAPKSVSLQALVGGDKRLIDAHNEAVKETLIEIEKNADTRIKENGKTRIENTGKLAIATFRHDTNRNNEPHLHTHSVVINFTKRNDGEFRALHNDKIVKNIKEYTAMYQSNMAKKAKDLGYNIRHNANGTFDLSHISKEQLQAFSTRSKEINDELEKNNLSRETASTNQISAATLSTRKRKDQNIDKDKIRNQWIKDADKLNIQLSPGSLHEVDRSIYKNKVTEKFDMKIDAFQNENVNISLSQVKKLTDVENIKPTNLNIQKLNIEISSQISKEQYSNDPTKDVSSKETSIRDKDYRADELLHRELSVQAKRSSDTSGELKTSRTYNMSNMPSFYVVQETRNINMPLSFDQSEYMGNPRTEHNHRLRWSDDSNPANARNIENTSKHINNEKQDGSESLNEILTYDLPNTELVERWNRLAESIDFDKGETINQVESEDQIIDLVIEHVTDKKVEITAKELREQLLIKGQGVIDYKNIDNLIDKAIEEEKLVYADTKYKLADERNDENAISYIEWVEKLEKKDIENKKAKSLVDMSIEKGRLVKTDDIYVTSKHLESEKIIIDSIKNSPKLDLIVEKDKINNYLENSTLNKGQKEAVELILSSHEQVVGVQGYAGTGKSYMLKTANKIAENNNKEMIFLAPYSSQVKSLKDDGLEANTLASFIMSKKKQEQLNENSVIVVDEAGVVNTKQMEKLVKITNDSKAKLVLLGDTSQTKAIEAGAPFDLMQRKGMKTAVMDDIQRQKNTDLKQAVVNAANNETDKAISHLKNINEIKDKEERHQAIADFYSKLSEEEKKNTIVVSGTNLDRSDINNKIREKSGIAGNGINVSQLKATDHTKAELKLARSYEKGQFVEFSFDQKKLNITKGNSYEIIDNNNNEITIEDNAGKKLSINPKITAMTIYDRSNVEISKGDILRVTKSNKDLNQSAGDIYTVLKINKENNRAYVEEKNGKIKELDLSKNNHLDHAYAMTVHSSQGLTVDNVIVNLDTKSKTTNKEAFYVAISRARHEAYVYTENIQDLPNSVSKLTVKNNAVELIKNNSNNYKKDKSIDFEL